MLCRHACRFRPAAAAVIPVRAQAPESAGTKRRSSAAARSWRRPPEGGCGLDFQTLYRTRSEHITEYLGPCDRADAAVMLRSNQKGRRVRVIIETDAEEASRRGDRLEGALVRQK